MRAAPLVLLVGSVVVSLGSLGGCVVRSSNDEPPVLIDPPHLGCHDDSACRDGKVCARTGACLLPSEVRAIHVSWTVSGKPASPDSCAAAPNLRIDLDSSHLPDRLAFAPVPCAEGKFSVDKAPLSINHASLVRDSGGDGFRDAMIDAATGEASMDLPY